MGLAPEVFGANGVAALALDEADVPDCASTGVGSILAAFAAPTDQPQVWTRFLKTGLVSGRVGLGEVL